MHDAGVPGARGARGGGQREEEESYSIKEKEKEEEESHLIDNLKRQAISLSRGGRAQASAPGL